jgi:hypothetical protein
MYNKGRIPTAPVGTDAELEAEAEKAVIALEEASIKDLTIETNLKAAENLVEPAKVAVAKVTDTNKNEVFNARITVAEARVLIGRTNFDKASSDAAALAAALAKVNNAADVTSMQAAITNPDLGLNLTTYNELNAYNKTLVAKGLLEKMPNAGYDDKDAVQTALDETDPITAQNYADLKAGVEKKVAAYEKLANGDLSTQELIDAAKTAKAAINLEGLKDADKTAFQIRIDAANAKVTNAENQLAVNAEAAKVAATFEAKGTAGTVKMPTVDTEYTIAVKTTSDSTVYDADGKIVKAGTSKVVYTVTNTASELTADTTTVTVTVTVE